MNQQQYESYLLWSAILCLVLAAVNAAQVKKRGTRVWFMVGACVTLAATLLATRAGGGTFVQAAGGALVFGLLVFDLSKRPSRKKK